MTNNNDNFVDNTPEVNKPHNIAGNNPRSAQVLHKAQIKPRSQDKDIKITKITEEETDYQNNFS